MPQQPHHSSPQQSNRPAILIVDDVEANLVAMDALLSDLDCTLVFASSGNEALRLLLKQEFAAVLLDVQMPEMDGFEVARLARMNPKSQAVPIIFVTAMFETEEGLFRGYDSGAVDVLFKPLNPHVLLSKVKVFLELERSRRRLKNEIEAHERTLAELDAFNYSVSHDLRAPLRPIAGFSQILIEDYGDQLDDNARSLLKRIEGAAIRMGRIIDDLLHLSKISRSQMSRERIDLTALVETIIGEIRVSDPTPSREKETEIVIAPEMVAQGDPRLLRSALANLLGNAWKFTSKTSGARIEVGVLRLGEGHEDVYFVSDNGVGFDPSHVAKLFRPFQRLHSLAEFEGTGIGLAIVHRVIERHGGRIWAEATLNQGAKFSFTLG